MKRDWMMSEGYGESCVCADDRPSNDELSALIAQVVMRGQDAPQRLFSAVAPLLSAFYEGHIQAGRAKREDLETLVQRAFLAVCQRHGSFDGGHPFRAWLIEIARSTLLDYLVSQSANRGGVAPVVASPIRRKKALRAV
jgi:RNA polymerase sigma-70 factor (ECF subfamily)